MSKGRGQKKRDNTAQEQATKRSSPPKQASVEVETPKPAERVVQAEKPIAAPAVQETKPTVQEAKPVVQEAKPVVQEAKPVVQEAKPPAMVIEQATDYNKLSTHYLQLLVTAASKFLVDAGIQASSLDWFREEWGRDTFISLPGLLLCTSQYSLAKNILSRYGSPAVMSNGLIPNKIESNGSRYYNTADASMWFIQAVKSYYKAVSCDVQFLMDMKQPMEDIISAYRDGTSFVRNNETFFIKMDSTDSLIISPVQASWMDAHPAGGYPVTPRNGKTVEINALWYSNLRFLADLEHDVYNNKTMAQELHSLADSVKVSFQKFWFVTKENADAWGGQGGALADVLDGDSHSHAIRPNMLFAVSHGDDLCSPDQQLEIVRAATHDLLTPYGLRTLSYRDSHYHAVYNTNEAQIVKDQAYHQGTVWPWLMGTYCDALRRVRSNQGVRSNDIKRETSALLLPLLTFLEARNMSPLEPLGDHCSTLPEVFDGGDVVVLFTDPVVLPTTLQRPGGTRSQAWSIAEVLRIIKQHDL